MLKKKTQSVKGPFHPYHLLFPVWLFVFVTGSHRKQEMLSHDRIWSHIIFPDTMMPFCFLIAVQVASDRNPFILQFLGSHWVFYFYLLFWHWFFSYHFKLFYPTQPFLFNMHRTRLWCLFYDISHFSDAIQFRFFFITAQCSLQFFFLNKCGLLIWKHCVICHADSFKYGMIEKFACYWNPLNSGNSGVLTSMM